MGLNLSRGKPIKYYSSDRIAQLLGNGLLTFIDAKTQFNNFFNKDEVIFYNNLLDLSEKLNYYKENDELRRKIAKKGREKYFALFESQIICDHILSKIFDFDIKKKLKWMEK